MTNFTRDYDKLLNALKALPVGDLACPEVGLDAVSDIIIDEWAYLTSVQVLLITDTTDNVHASSIKSLCQKLQENRKILKEFYAYNGCDFDERIHTSSILNAEELLKSNFYMNLNSKNYFQIKYPFSFPNRFDIICLKNESESNHLETVYGFAEESFKFKKYVKKAQNKSYYLNQLIQLNNSTGKLFITNKVLSEQYIEKEFITSIINELYNPFECQLNFGHMKSKVCLIPAPNKFNGYFNKISKNKKIYYFRSILIFILFKISKLFICK